jgi:hypothetical protein
MDAYLYVVALAVFGILYLVLGVFLVFALLISLLAIFLYLVLRHSPLPEHYPFTAGDSIITVVFIGVTWGFFTLLGPKDPVPFVGSGLTYSTASPFLIDAVLIISVVALFVFLVIGALIIPRMTKGGRSGGGTGGSPGQQTPGAG